MAPAFNQQSQKKPLEPIRSNSPAGSLPVVTLEFTGAVVLTDQEQAHVTAVEQQAQGQPPANNSNPSGPAQANQGPTPGQGQGQGQGQQ